VKLEAVVVLSDGLSPLLRVGRTPAGHGAEPVFQDRFDPASVSRLRGHPARRSERKAATVSRISIAAQVVGPVITVLGATTS